MPYVKLEFPPGIVRPGTVYDARGRWYDAPFMRWHGAGRPVLQPVGGWSVLSGAGSSAVGGPVRGMHAWRRNAGTAFVALGTRTKLYVYSAGTLSDVTPSAFTTGALDASGTFYARTEAHSWQFDNFGEDLVACSYSDGRIVLWDSSVGVGTAAAVLAGAPTSCKGVVVTPERFLVALGASGDGRLVAWADQESTTDWTPDVDNQAGDFTLQGSGQIMAGRNTTSETLIWTDQELYAMEYIGGTLVYQFNLKGSKCGAISRRSMVARDGKAIWMGQRGFFMYDGFVRPIPCEIDDYVFSSINRAQASKIACWTLSEFNETWWAYPSANSTEVDRYVVYNDALGWWNTGPLARTDGLDRGFLEYPLMAGADSAVYEHEKATTYQEEGGTTYTPYAESGPWELGEGDQVFTVMGLVPDEETLGEANVRLYTRIYPTASETTSGPYTLANPTNIRLTARQVRVRATQVTGGFRWGTPRLDVTPGGLR